MTPEPPAQPKPVRMPSIDDPDIKAAAKAKTAEEFAKREGRKSTNLTDTPYSRTTLG